jgi:pyridoxamine 5'-phosphate oxidase
MAEKKNQSKSVADIRRDYTQKPLVESDVCENPIDEFMEWFEQALSTDMADPNAMTLATATREGVPSSRIVLLKGVDEQGFRFYSNYKSRKARELAENPRAALCFYWPSLERQIRIEGKVQKLSQDDSEAYFQQRPRLSQIGAWASKQSSKLSSRDELEEKFEEMKKRFENKEIPLPDFWGGYLLKPTVIEFWQGRESRMHDRIRYEKEGQEWKTARLAP